MVPWFGARLGLLVAARVVFQQAAALVVTVVGLKEVAEVLPEGLVLLPEVVALQVVKECVAVALSEVAPLQLARMLWHVMRPRRTETWFADPREVAMAGVGLVAVVARWFLLGVFRQEMAVVLCRGVHPRGGLGHPRRSRLCQG